MRVSSHARPVRREDGKWRNPSIQKDVRLHRGRYAALRPAVRSLPRRGGSQNQSITAREVVARIQAQVGVPWREKTVDTFKAGNPDTVVTGIATTVMATLDVLRQAVAAKRNLVITHEPTFYTGTDEPGPRANDPVYLAKRAFIDEHHLVIGVFRSLARAPAGRIHACAGRCARLDGRRAIRATSDSSSFRRLP